MKSFFKLLEKTAGPIGLLTATAGAILDFLAPLGNYIYLLAAILLVLTVLSAICSKSNPILQKVKNSTAFAPDFIKKELVELWQPDGVAFWKKGLFQVLTFLTALSLGAGVYAKDNPKGFLATKIDSVASLQTSLGLIDSKLGDISAKQDKIIEVIESTDKKIDLVKKESSDNPRKELANLGIDWSEESFVSALKQGDLATIELFLKGGMNPTNKSINYGGNSYIALITSWKVPKIIETITLFEKYGLDINQKFPYETLAGLMEFKQVSYSLLTIAIESDNLPLIEYLVKVKKFDIKKTYDEAGNLYSLAANSAVVDVETFKLLTTLLSDKDMKANLVDELSEHMFNVETCITELKNDCIYSHNSELARLKQKLFILEGKS
jgi:hypothetical protein